jgi:hypothetical protein
MFDHVEFPFLCEPCMLGGASQAMRRVWSLLFLLQMSIAA